MPENLRESRKKATRALWVKMGCATLWGALIGAVLAAVLRALVALWYK